MTVPSVVRIRPVRSLLLIAASLTSLAAAEGGADQLAELKAQVESLTKQVQKLTADKVGETDLESVRSDLQVFKDQYTQDREKRSPISARGITVSGLIQGRWTGTTVENNRGTKSNSFDIPSPRSASQGTSTATTRKGRISHSTSACRRSGPRP
jgi:hypothetical protein